MKLLRAALEGAAIGLAVGFVIIGIVVLVTLPYNDKTLSPIGPGATLQEARKHFSDDLPITVVGGGVTCLSFISKGNRWAADLCFRDGPVKR